MTRSNLIFALLVMEAVVFLSLLLNGMNQNMNIMPVRELLRHQKFVTHVMELER